MGCLENTINLMIIGVEKAGTTALYRHLAQSPYVFVHEQREMFYFLSDEEYQRGWSYAMSKYFNGHEGELLVAKNVMQINSPVALARLKEHCPESKCVVMLREPAARAYSAYHYARLRGMENCETFEEALTLEDARFLQEPVYWAATHYLRNSTYALRLSAAFEMFGRDNILVLFHEEYKVNPRAQLERIESFVGRDLFHGINLRLGTYNRAAKARSPWLAKQIYRFLQSRGPIKRSLRAVLPHKAAVRFRHGVLNLNRVEAPYEPMSEQTAKEIREKLKEDRRMIVDLVGYCPWDE